MRNALNMVSGTGKEVAAVALARLLRQSVPFCAPMPAGGSVGSLTYMGEPIEDAYRTLSRGERREHVKAGALPGSSRYAHTVPLGVEMVEVDNGVRSYSGKYARLFAPSAKLSPEVIATLAQTVEGSSQLWFNDVGDAFLSFEHEGDAVLFEVALDGDRS